MTLFVLLVALAACVAAGSAQASSGVQFGIQDEVVEGPGIRQPAAGDARAAGVPIVRFTLRWNQTAPRRPRIRLAARSRLDWRRPDPSSARFAVTV